MEISELYGICKDVNWWLGRDTFSHGRDSQMQQQKWDVWWTSWDMRKWSKVTRRKRDSQSRNLNSFI